MRERLGGLSLRFFFIWYVAVFLLAGTAVSAVIINAANRAVNGIYASYQDPGDRYYLTTEDGKRLGEGAVVLSTPREISEGDKRKIAALGAVSSATIPVVFIFGVVLVAFLFYRNKLKRPLALLAEASARIGRNDLGFTLCYEKQDEMGALCDSFEKMRQALQENNLEMWRQMEERRQLNAAFSHDLRTPLTVLKGQSELLLKYIPQGKMPSEKLLETVDTMRSHIVRLEAYTEAMTALQKLEDIEIRKSDVPAGELIRRLAVGGRILCGDKRLRFKDDGLTAESLHVDLPVVLQVYENLLSNAARYAQDTVLVSLSRDEGALAITVADDGPGFGARDLREAVKPFYHSGPVQGKHFGIGLTICKLLCEKHGGHLKLSNLPDGAAVKAVF